MSAVVRQTIIELSFEDRELLERLADYLGVPRVVVIRWAIRAYALDGGWAVTVAEREAICDGLGPLDCGPQRRGPQC